MEAIDPVARLARYWLRAELMHDRLHELRVVYNRDLQQLYDDGHGYEFEAYLQFWLSGLFVVVEGFNKLKLEDGRVQKLFNAHVGELKKLRHETFHFVEAYDGYLEMVGGLNWAEELHEAIGEHIRKYIDQKALDEMK
jgi:hypothetical protein